jgi:hypothetical protein
LRVTGQGLRVRLRVRLEVRAGIRVRVTKTFRMMDRMRANDRVMFRVRG